MLFTSPEDMIMGKSCQLHQKEVTTQRAARDLKTTSNLVDAAMNFEMEKVQYMYHTGVYTHTCTCAHTYMHIQCTYTQQSCTHPQD